MLNIPREESKWGGRKMCLTYQEKRVNWGGRKMCLTYQEKRVNCGEERCA